MLLSEFFDSIYAPRRLRGKSLKSYALYRLCLRRFGETLGRQPRVGDLTEENILAHLKRRSTVAPATRNKELAELTALWRMAVQRGMRDGWPEIQAEPEPQRVPRAWTREEIERLLAACGRTSGMIGEVPARVWWPAIVRLCIDTGERIGAVRRCQWSWFEGRSILIPAEVRKGNKRDKWFPLTPETITAIEAIRAYRTSRVDGAIFAWPFAPTSLWTKYRSIVKSAGLPTGRMCAWHRLRKTAASVVYAAGLDPQDLLDHSDRRTTQRYLDPRFAREKQPADVIAEWLRNPPRRGDEGKHEATG